MQSRLVLPAVLVLAALSTVVTGCGVIPSSGAGAGGGGGGGGAPAATAPDPAGAGPVAGGAGSANPAGSAQAGSSPAADSRAAGADSGLGSVKDAGAIPDPCTLLSEAEVTALTGRDITQIDEDGVPAGDTTRYCQWQQNSGQLAIFLSRTTAADFQLAIDGAEPVDGVGEDAFWLSGHLFVLYGTVQIDVYSRGGSDGANLADAKTIATTVMPRI
ncbi:MULTISPECIES: hypothetical protein [Catenuloplanes]|uniref:DUF3558 domain-containing protein n=1 Tax=Catenuloplanes niger TaxID=587534 RepID=A0AAE3ZPD0_9ACTN|nr:hypothetical protein [Catenuloplanes niger]MDR7322431.1 hypothetical protein [Catenuloplanes niger]